MSPCHNNPEKLSTIKINEYAASGYSFDTRKNKLDCYRGKRYIERFQKDSKKHVTKITNYEKKKIWYH